VWVVAFGAACQYGVTPGPTAPATDSASTTPVTTAPGASTGLTYVKDIAPIMSSDCVICHGPSRRDANYDFSTYAGVMRAVGSLTASARLVASTQPGGLMYSQFRGNAAAKSKTIHDWVIIDKAAQQ